MIKISELLNLAAVKIDSGAINYNPTARGNDVLRNILNTAYFWATVIAVIAIIIAGFFYTTSMNNPNQVARAKNAILYAIVGLVVVIMAFAITNFVMEAL
jgi:hypothetical protein cdiviTM7_00612